MPLKVSMLFQVTTNPPNPQYAIPHTGGWSESFWSPTIAFFTSQVLAAYGNVRANLLPGQASIVGFRQSLYTVAGNKLLPGGVSTLKRLIAGNSQNITDLPQVSLEIAGLAAGAINGNRFRLGAIPDSMMTNGEYQPTPAFAGQVTSYLNLLSGRVTINGVNIPAVGFVGRDLAQPTTAVNAVANGVVTLRQNIGGQVNVDFLRLHRVVDIAGNPLRGSYLITGINGNAYTLQGLPLQVVTKPNGTARLDRIGVFQYAALNVSRAVVKKVGRPFQSYRGRQSNRPTI
jgi:hypothetical protein